MYAAVSGGRVSNTSGCFNWRGLFGQLLAYNSILLLSHVSSARSTLLNCLAPARYHHNSRVISLIPEHRTYNSETILALLVESVKRQVASTRTNARTCTYSIDQLVIACSPIVSISPSLQLRTRYKPCSDPKSSNTTRQDELFWPTKDPLAGRYSQSATRDDCAAGCYVAGGHEEAGTCTIVPMKVIEPKGPWLQQKGSMGSGDSSGRSEEGAVQCLARLLERSSDDSGLSAARGGSTVPLANNWLGALRRRDRRGAAHPAARVRPDR